MFFCKGNISKFAIIGLLFIVMLSLNGCSGLSNSELESIASEYKDSLQVLCDTYGLTDAVVEVGNTFPTRDESIKTYVDSAQVTSDKFNSLSAERAFSFAKEFAHLYNQYNSDKATVKFIASIYGKNNVCYTYEAKNSSTGKYEYLMKYSSAAVTYVNGNLIYDDFNN